MFYFRYASIFYVSVVFLLLPYEGQAEESFYAVATIINGKSFTLMTGETVRLAAIEAPNVDEPATLQYAARAGEPMGNEARDALTKLLQGKKVRILYNKDGRDRHNRLLGQVYRDDGLWIQGEMLNQGYAMAYSFADDAPELITKLLAEEHKAQEQKRGIWANPYFRIITPEQTEEFINRFKLVEGKVESVHASYGNIYINFSKDWHGHFAVFISKRDADRFDLLRLETLVGKTVRVRGWIHYHKAPEIELTHPQQIELE